MALTFYSVADLAREVSVHPATVRREIKRGNLRARRVGADGRVIRVSFEDAQAWLRGERVAS